MAARSLLARAIGGALRNVCAAVRRIAGAAVTAAVVSFRLRCGPAASDADPEDDKREQAR